MANEHLRDLMIGIAMDVNKGPMAELQREIVKLKKEITGMKKPIQDQERQHRKSTSAMISQQVALNNSLSTHSDEMRRLAKTSGVSLQNMSDDWRTMSTEARKSLIDNHNNMIKYRKNIMDVENDMRKLGGQMGDYKGSTDDFMKSVALLGARHKKASDAMINNNKAMRQSVIQQAATVMNLSTTSSKITKVYEDSGNALYAMNKPFLAITGRMEKMAASGNAAVLALKQLGPNASMKDLQDRIRLINTGIMRQQQLLLFGGIAWLGFTAIVAKNAMGPNVAENLAAQGKAWDDYYKKVKERTDEIYNTFGLFEEVTLQKTNPRRLYLNLEQQVKVMENWQTNLSKLAGKGLDQAFIQDLRGMGPAAAAEIEALTKMSAPGLDRYVALWKEKHQLARTSAETELEGLKRATQANVKALQDSLKPLGISVHEFKAVWSEALKPFVEFWGLLASYVVRAGTQVGKFIQRLNEISPWITKLGGMFIWLTMTFVLLLSPLAVGIGMLGGMKAGFAATWLIVKQFAIGLAATVGTAILVAAAIIAISAALYLLWTRNETFRKNVIGAWNQVKATALSVWGFIKPYIMEAIGAIVDFGRQKFAQLKTFWAQNGSQILQATKNFITPIWITIKTVMNAIWEVMKFIWPYVLMLIKSVWNNIKGVINGAIRVIMGVIKVFSGLFTGDFRKMWEGVKDIFFGGIQFAWNLIQLYMLGRILSAGRAFIGSFKGILVAGWNFIRNLFSKSISGISSTFSKGFTFLRTTADNIFNAITKGIVNFVMNAVRRFTGMVNEARRIFGMLRTFGANIFSALFQAIRTIVSRIVTGVRTGFTTMKNRAVDLATTMKTTVTNRFGEIVKAAKDLPGKIGGGIKTMAGKALGGIKHLANTMMAGLAQGVNGVGAGINWVFDKIGVDKKYNVPKWTPPEYAKGTNNHPGGPAIVGDGGGAELMRTRSGQVALSPSTSTLVNLPKGTEVLPHKQTAALMASGVPAYAKGTEPGLLAKAADAVKGAAGKVKDFGLDVFSMLGNPADMMKKVYDKFIPKLPSFSGAFGKIFTGGMGFLKDKALGAIKSKLPDMESFIGGGGSAPNVGKGVQVWRSYILRAAAAMGEAVTPAQVQGILAQIQRESGGNQSIVQSPLVRDINTMNGNPARGLLQYIPSTFRNYMMPGNTNIYSGYDQLLAFFNNTTWRRDLPYGKRGWSPRGARKFGMGGLVTQAQQGIVGEAGPEAIIPLSYNKRRRGLMLLNQAADALGVGITDGSASPAVSGRGGTVINYTPGPVTITVQGGSSEGISKAKAEFQQLLDEQYDKLNELLFGEGGSL